MVAHVDFEVSDTHLDPSEGEDEVQEDADAVHRLSSNDFGEGRKDEWPVEDDEIDGS